MGDLVGTEGDDFIVGTNGPDRLQGMGGNDVLFGEGEGDNLAGGDGDDYLDGGEGADYLEGGFGRDSLDAGGANDVAFGGHGNDNLIGGDGDDYLNGGEGADYLEGGTGRDSLDAAGGNDVAFGGLGNDNLIGGDGDDYLNGGAEIDYLEGGSGSDSLDGGAGDDLLLGGVGADNLIAGDGADYLNGGDGIDYLEGGAGNDTLDAGIGDDILVGGDGSDSIAGGDGADYLDGGLGNDGLDGGAGADTMAGGPGDDFYFIDDAGDIVAEAADEGQDRVIALVSYALAAGSHVESLSAGDPAGTAPIALTGNELDNTLQGNAGANRLDGGSGRDNLLGGDGDDYLIGGADVDYLDGGAGSDALEAGAGNDLLFGGAGGDSLAGGDGDDYLDAGEDADFLDGGVGNDALETGAGNDVAFGGAGGDNLIGGSGDDYLDGGDGADYLDGGVGKDALETGAGNDVAFGGEGGDNLIGGSGDDYLDGGDGADYLDGGLGNDSIDAGAGDDIALGGEGGDNLIGRDGADYLDGGDGADYLEGGVGNDTLQAGAGDDFALGGDGNDYIATGDGRDYLHGGLDNDRLIGGADGDGLHGGDGDDWLEGGDGGDYLDGGAGGDALDGGAGNDIMLGGEGNNNLLGGEGDDYLNAGSGADYLDGGLGNDALEAGAGNDVVFGGEGGDNLIGGDGDDYLNAGNGIDYLEGGLGNDTLEAGADDDILVGGDGGDSMAGGDGADYLDGGAGNDSLSGGLGADTLVGGAGDDRFVFNTALSRGNVDSIPDLVAGAERIVLDGNPGGPFAALASGALAPGALAYGTAALDANDYLLYDSATGALLYDADGNGAGVALQFATLAPGLVLSSNLFEIAGNANNLPVLTSGSNASIAENSPVSTIVYQIAAADPDGDRVTYSLGGADAGSFTVDQSGAVRLAASANYEVRTSYSITVHAADSSAAATKQINVTVTDVEEGGGPTPLISETNSANDSVSAAQPIDRNLFTVSNNPNLPNDDLPSGTIQGNVSAPTDKDFFRITLQAGELLILDVDNSSGNLDAMLRIFSASGAELVSNDDPGNFDVGSEAHEYGHNTDSFIRFRAPSTGVYYFSMEAFQDPAHPTFGTYQLHVSIGPVATAAELLNEDIAALISGAKWDHLNLTFSFPTSTAQYPSGIEETDSASDNFEAFNAVQQGAVRAFAGNISAATKLTFQELFANPGIADLRYAMSDDPNTAHAYYPTNKGPSSLGGTAWFNNSGGRFDNPAPGNYGWMGILHETGHALGLAHGHEGPVSFDRDTLEYTVMTYRSYRGASVDDGSGYSNESGGYPQTLMMLDIAALQRMYGPNFSHNAGDTIYSWNSANGQMFINSVAQHVPVSNRIFLTIWDGGGNDTYDVSTYSSTLQTPILTIDLRPGEWSTFSNVQIANLGDGQMARGNVANALLFNGDRSSLIENVLGSQGQDQIVANEATNRLTGNGGADTFRWASSADSGVGPLADTVADFIRGQDRIDLSAIDAIPGGTNDAFSFIGTSAFSNLPGELRYQVEGASVRVQADLDGNGLADIEIILHNTNVLTGTDFFL